MLFRGRGFASTLPGSWHSGPTRQRVSREAGGGFSGPDLEVARGQPAATLSVGALGPGRKGLCGDRPPARPSFCSLSQMLER